MLSSVRRLIAVSRTCRRVLSGGGGSGSVLSSPSPVETIEALGFPDWEHALDNRVVRIPAPQARGGELLIQVKAASLNPIDAAIRDGYGRQLFGSIHPDAPFVTGCDASGVVLDTGGGSWDFREGDEVVVAVRPSLRGTHATRIAVSETSVALKPKHIGFVEAASFPFAWCTALSALSIANVREGQSVFIHGGSGTIGRFVVQYLKQVVGQVAVTASCSETRMADVLALGADAVVDYRAPHQLTELAGQFDVVISPTPYGVDISEQSSLALLRRGGTFITLRGSALALVDRLGLVAGAAASAATLVQNKARALATHGVRYEWGYFQSRFLPLATQLLADGRVSAPRIDSVFRLQDGAAAFDRLRSGAASGKVLLCMEDDLMQEAKGVSGGSGGGGGMGQ